MDTTLNLAAALRCRDLYRNARIRAVLARFEYALGPDWMHWYQQVPPPFRGLPCSHPHPCPYFSCRYHMALDRLKSGNLRLARPDTPISQMSHTCLWDMISAYPQGMTEPEIGEALGVNRNIIGDTLRRLLHRRDIRAAMQRFAQSDEE